MVLVPFGPGLGLVIPSFENGKKRNCSLRLQTTAFPILTQSNPTILGTNSKEKKKKRIT
jgi:hypothetical protein